MPGDIVAMLALAIWLYLLVGRGRFWRARERDSRNEPPPPPRWPRVTAVIPARDEAESIAETIRSLLAQAYPGPFSVILVDDESRDGTADVARAAARTAGAADRLTVLSGRPLPPGWTGKLWAMRQGIAAASASEAA